MKRAYIAGPMRTYPRYNFPAFDLKRDELQAKGYSVMSPADMDRAHGFDAMALPDSDACTGWPESVNRREVVMRDILAIVEWADEVHCLLGWERSKGANMEVNLALMLGLPVYLHDGTPYKG